MEVRGFKGNRASKENKENKVSREFQALLVQDLEIVNVHSQSCLRLIHMHIQQLVTIM